MTDRASFLAAIKEAGANDTPRLVFADWLDDNGTTDADAARAEYIRLSCTSGYKLGVKRRVGVKEGRWLGANWRRLLPTLIGAGTPPGNEIADVTSGTALRARHGRALGIRWHHTWASGDKTAAHSGVSTVLRFWRGFAKTFDVYSPRLFYLMGGLLRADEPFITPQWVEPLYRLEQDAAGVVLAARVNRGHVGPMFDYVTGHDETPADDVKQFLVDGQIGLGLEYITQVATESVERATERWLAEHAGKSYAVIPFGGLAGKWREVTCPMNLSQPKEDSP